MFQHLGKFTRDEITITVNNVYSTVKKLKHHYYGVTITLSPWGPPIETHESITRLRRSPKEHLKSLTLRTRLWAQTKRTYETYPYHISKTFLYIYETHKSGYFHIHGLLFSTEDDYQRLRGTFRGREIDLKSLKDKKAIDSWVNYMSKHISKNKISSKSTRQYLDLAKLCRTTTTIVDADLAAGSKKLPMVK